MSIELSIITINYNGVEDTCQLIETLPLDDTSVEVIVVDNASRQDEASMIESRFPQVRVIRSQQNLGFAGGNNLGIQAARGRYLFFINNDTLLNIKNKKQGNGRELTGDKNKQAGEGDKQTSCFQPLIDRLESSDAIGMVCPKIRFSWADHPIQFAGYTPLSHITLRNRSIGFGEPDYGQYDVPHSTPYAHGAAMMVKREVIHQAGVMPECYFLYYEELDWSMMIRRAGYEIWYEPSFTVYHKESQSTGQTSPLKTYYITRNRLLFVKRNQRGTDRFLSYLYLMGGVALRDVVKHLCMKRPDLAKATLRGIIHFIKL